MALFRCSSGGGGAKVKIGTTVLGGTVDLGFRPKYVAIQTYSNDTHRGCAIYDETISSTKQVRAIVGASITCTTMNIGVAQDYVCTFSSITDTGFSVNNASNTSYGTTVYYFAIG